MRSASTTVIACLACFAVGHSAWSAGATVTVDRSRTTAAFPADAVGLSYEMRTVGEGGFDAASGNEAALFRTLGVHHIRIGGNTVDYGTFWQTGGQPVPSWASIIITPADAARVAAFAAAVDARVAWAVNIQHLDAKLIETEVGTVVSAFGAHLESIQCGNEPNSLFAGYPAFKSAFDVCKGAIAGRAKISGPDTFGGGSAWNAPFAADESDVLGQLNYHYYTGARTAAALLAPAAISGALSAIAGSLAAAKAHGLAYRTDETNSEAGGGVKGVSDVFGAALWAMHYALATAESGAGIDFHGFLGVCGQPTVNGKNDFYTPICAASPADATAKVMTAAPEFYGLWMATHLGPGKFHPVTVAGAPSLVAFAVAADDGTTRLALIEKSATGGMLPVNVALGGVDEPAAVIHLTGSSLTAPTEVQVQGASVDRAGQLTPGTPDRAMMSGGSLSLMLPTGSAALVTIGAPPPPTDGALPDAAAPLPVDAAGTTFPPDAAVGGRDAAASGAAAFKGEGSSCALVDHGSAPSAAGVALAILVLVGIALRGRRPAP
jgi:hypothetical protein